MDLSFGERRASFVLAEGPRATTRGRAWLSVEALSDWRFVDGGRGGRRRQLLCRRGGRKRGHLSGRVLGRVEHAGLAG
jgi:hypothetical protein